MPSLIKKLSQIIWSYLYNF